MLCRFCRLGHYWTLRALGWSSPLGWALLFLFLFLAASVGGWASRGLHGLTCKFSAGCFPRHSAMNDVIKRALQKAGLPSVLEPPELDWGDGSRPNGITVFPYSGDRSLVWNCTCVDTFAEVQLNRSAMEGGTSAKSAEERERRNYSQTVILE